MEGVPLPPGIPGLGASTDPLEAVLGPFPCVKLRNLPFDATLEDILVLFQGLVVLDVLIVGQGEAFVLFSNPMDFQMAMQRYVLICPPLVTSQDLRSPVAPAHVGYLFDGYL